MLFLFFLVHLALALSATLSGIASLRLGTLVGNASLVLPSARADGTTSEDCMEEAPWRNVGQSRRDLTPAVRDPKARI